MISGVVLDLDNTLYDHAEFVRGAYRDVAAAAAKLAGLSAEEFLARTFPRWEQLGSGATHIFADALRDLGVYSPELERQLVEVYRAHEPGPLTPFADALPSIAALREAGLAVGLLSDGQSTVQRRKLCALGMPDLFDAVIITGDLGREFYKPHEAAFRAIADALRLPCSALAFIGDNPRVDFQTPRQLGAVTIRVLTGEYRALPSPDGAVDHTCPDLASASRCALQKISSCVS